MEAFTLRWNTISGRKIMKGHNMSITIGDILHIDIPTRDDQVTTSVIGQVTGLAESFINPDNIRVHIAGLDTWVDLSNKDWKVV